jgi:arabinose-5-phosphate isomerase
MGKSQYPARRLADTLCSIDVPAVYVNPAEIDHGMAGLLKECTRLYAFTQSGRTAETLRVVRAAEDVNARIIWVSSIPGKAAWEFRSTVVNAEGDPFNTNAVPLESIIEQEQVVNLIIRELMRSLGEAWCRRAVRSNHTGGSIGESLR